MARSHGPTDRAGPAPAEDPDVGSSGPSLIVIATQVAVHPGQGRASFQAAVVAAGRGPILLAESDIAIPARGWELRGSALWADHICESPFEHWSYGLEAFALGVEDPAELLGPARGERIPLGWELEFESQTDPELLASENGYRQLGTGHGLLLIGDLELEVDGRALRAHRWGSPARDVDQLAPSPEGGAGPEAGFGRAIDAGEQGDLLTGPLLLPAPDGVWEVRVAGTGTSTGTSTGTEVGPG